MSQQTQNKEFIARYFSELSSSSKTKELLDKYIADEALLQHIDFFEAAFPDYKLIADELTAEDNRVVAKARFIGVHEGELNGIPPTHRTVEFKLAVGYEIENEKIISHWLLADQMALMEQLGVMNVSA